MTGNSLRHIPEEIVKKMTLCSDGPLLASSAPDSSLLKLGYEGIV